ncbi:MAG TPA: tRNA pseudouridine(13) synthase TruD [Thermoplasmata archaeon]|nr:tRNA pseudouridine(13) synthase TruD [Thermoplasmata archaeon]
MTDLPRPPERERALGLRCYGTSTPGTGGRIKARPEEFEVREISAHPVPDESGGFTILRIESTMREQHALVAELSRLLGVGPGAIGWAGTKDRRAVTEQLFSVHAVDLPLDRLERPGLRLLDAYRAGSGLVLGHHFGNRFRIRVVDVLLGPAEAQSAAESTAAALRAAGGVPNYFGLQRFGEVRPVTHLVGLALLRGDVSAAVETYLAAEAGEETGPGAEARRSWRRHHDPARALREFPSSYLFERRMLDHLARGHDPERALRSLPRELRVLFVHAYQSWLFNEYLSQRIEGGSLLGVLEPGETLLRVAKDGTVPGTGAVPVTADNLVELTELVRRGGAVRAGPLVGFGMEPLNEPTRALVAPLLTRDGLELRNFRMPAIPELASEGRWRPLLCPWPTIALRFPAAPEAAVDRAYELEFALPKGAYATVVLREFTKN